MRTLVKLCLAAGLTAMISGCGHPGKAMATDDQMLDKAEFATGIDRSQLSIVKESVKGSIDSVEYKVKSKNGKTFRCYFTTALLVQSDAICTAIDKTGKAFDQQKKKAREDGNCNALLKAAGRC